MKFIDSNDTPSLQFKDVPTHRLFIDCSGELLIKLDMLTACRIATCDGLINAKIFTPCESWGIKEILPYDKVEF